MPTAGFKLKRCEPQFHSCVICYRGADKSLARPGRKQARKNVTDARDFNNIETRAVIVYFFLARQCAEGNSRHCGRNIDRQRRCRPIKILLIILEMKSTDESIDQPADNAFILHTSCK